jgi:2-oxoglutarate ferredoxin oxidoreductase subunit alpha
MCATSGGGFALMTEAIGMAGMIETPVVIVNVTRGGPSTGLPTKTEQGDLNQIFGASQGDYPRVIIAPKDAQDCYYTVVEALNLAETFQLPVVIMSDLLLAEHRSTVDSELLTPDVAIERGEWVNEPIGGVYKRYQLTSSGVSPRARPGIEGLIHVAATDDHDERGVLISDEHTNAAIRRKMHEKRMRKMDEVLARLPPPKLEGPAEADVTLISWGSSWGVVREAVEQLNRGAPATNQLHFKYLHPFPQKESLEILRRCRTTIVVENNFSGQFRRHLRAETGFSADHLVRRYDGEPFEPAYVRERVGAIVAGQPEDLRVQEAEAREIAYHFIRVNLGDKSRPGRLEKAGQDHYGEPVWDVEIIERAELVPQGRLIIGMETGSIHTWRPV